MAYPSDPLDIRVPGPEPKGTTGRVVHNVARAYIEGLERDRGRLRQLEEQYDRLVWETIQVSAYAKALYTALYQYRQAVDSGRYMDADMLDDLLAADRCGYFEIWSCACGHHRYDHDEHGRCEYLACRHICGKEQ